MKKVSDCVFCRIIAREIPSTIIKETNDILVIKDINPKAPIHYLIIPKIHKENVLDLADNDQLLAGSLLLMARNLAQELPGSKGFRLHINNGEDAGQIVHHLHIHFLAGNVKHIGL